MKFRIMRLLIRLWVALIARVEIQGMQKLPEGNLFVVANHLGRLDSAVMFCLIDREDVIMPIAGKYRHHPLYGLMGWAMDGIWLSRDGSDTTALRQTLARMKQGGLLVMAPEGTRSPTEAMQEARLGAAFLADKSGYPVRPGSLGLRTAWSRTT
jgi:1-acyl-sn-glycerol-3-phosphate acyltransferase